MVKKFVRDQLARALDFAASNTSHPRELRASLDVAVEAVVSHMLATDEVAFPALLARELRALLGPKQRRMETVKAAQTEAARVFAERLDILRYYEPPIDLGLAKKVALIADRLHANYDDSGERVFRDVSIHFAMASSLADKGRLVSNLVRLMRPASMLEIGTAYGLGSYYMLETQRRCGLAPKLATIEMSESRHALASRLLIGEFGDAVDCLQGLKEDLLPDLVGSRSFDFVFHDGPHSGDHYVHDFTAIEPALGSGACFLLDDLRWDDAPENKGAYETALTCYEGWRKIVEHPRVAAAVEFDGQLGAVFLS